jgi:hydrogenase maturation protease
MTGPTIVIGVGNPYRRDDGLGPAVISLLRSHRLPGVVLAECDGEPTRMIDLWAGASLAVVVDAVRTAPATPGRVHRFSAYHPAVMAAPAAASSHGVSLGEVVDLARALDRMPERLLLIAVEAADVDFGTGLSPAVAGAAVEVAQEIAELVAVARGRRGVAKPRWGRSPV